MKAIAVFMLFVGMFLVVQGYYAGASGGRQCPPAKTEIRFIPRSVYEEQLGEQEPLTRQFKSMFEDIQPWPTVRG